MKLLYTTALLLALTAPALADITSGNNVVGNGNIVAGHDQVGTFNTGTGAGATFAPSASANSTNVNIAAGGSAKSNATARQKQSQNQGQFQSSTAAVKGSGNSNNENSVTVQAQKRNPVATAYAAPLVAAEDTCMGSTSAGGQGVGFGISIGSTWSDPDCVRRKDARELHNMGYRPAAIALLCQSDKVRKAMKTAGTPCHGAEDEYVPSAGDVVQRSEYPAASSDSPKH